MTLRLAAAALLLGLVAARAWVCDDAYISFRTLENLLDGYGLRWNVDERVQVYTHPLWLLLVAPFRALRRSTPACGGQGTMGPRSRA